MIPRSLSASIIKACLLISAQLPLLHSHPILRRDVHDENKEKDRSFWIYIGVSIILVLLGGVFAGLTLGLMGQDEVYVSFSSSFLFYNNSF